MKDYAMEVLEVSINEVIEQRKHPNYISILAINNVPYINFPDLTENECIELQEQTKNILRISRNENQFKEVTITYDIHSNELNKYKKILGSIGSIPLMDNTDTRDLILNKNESKELVVINIHNHPNDSSFSINDLLIFANNPSIKIMEIVNTKGEISFLYRTQYEKYTSLISEIILDVEPYFKNNIKNFIEINNHKNYKISDIISDKENRKLIINESIIGLQQCGVVYCEYTKNSITIEKNQRPSSYKISQNIINVKNLNEETDLYFDNGEDDYEWE